MKIKTIGFLSCLSIGLIIGNINPIYAETNSIVTAFKEENLDEVYVTAEDGLNIRISPSTNSKIITTVPYGTKLEVIGDSRVSNWYIIRYNNKAHFVNKECVSKEKPDDIEEVVQNYEPLSPFSEGYTYLSSIEVNNYIPAPVETIEQPAEDIENTSTTQSSAKYSASDFKFSGIINENGYRWTWYSQNVLPGGGLDIPGRHTDENGYVKDEDGYICLASSDLEKGSVVETPFGAEGKVYDSGCASGTLDVYTGW